MSGSNNYVVLDGNGNPLQFEALYNAAANTLQVVHALADSNANIYDSANNAFPIRVMLANNPVTNTNPLSIQHALPGGVMVGTANALGANAMSLSISDGLVANKATVAAFHSADNTAPGGTAFGLMTGGVEQLLNQAGNLDRQRNNQDPTANSITFAATNTSANTSDQINFNGRGVIAYLSISANTTATVNAVVTLYSKDPVSGQYFPQGASANLLAGNIANGWAVTFYPGISVSNTALNTVVPRTFKVGVAFTGAGAITGALNLGIIL